MTILAIGQNPPYPFFLQSEGFSNTSGTVSLGFAANNRTGSLLFCAVVIEDGTSTVSTITDTQSNTWQSATTLTAYDATNRIQCWYAMNSVTGANTVTVTASAGTPRVNALIAEFAGVATSSALDKQATGSVADDPTSGNVTPTTDRQLIVGACVNVGGAATAGSGYMRIRDYVFNIYSQLEWREQFVAGAIAANWVTVGANTGLAQVCTFKALPL